MRRWAVPGGLRTRLALAIALVSALGVGASFLALYGESSARLRNQIDSQLRTQQAEWHQFIAASPPRSATALERDAHAFIAAQRYHAEALVIAVQPVGRPVVTNFAELLTRAEREPGAGLTLLTAPPGLSTVALPEASDMRLLSERVTAGGRGLGMVRLADPLAPVAAAQASLRRSFALVGVLVLALAIAAGVGLAALIARPLRRITGVATAISEGDLSIRAGTVAGSGEVGVLSDAFDGMLDRLERTIKRQRDFVSDASHELRTPLAVMRAQVELLEGEEDAQRRHDANATLLARLAELDRLVADLLTLAGAESGQLVVAREIALEDYFEDLRRDLPLFGERAFRLDGVAGTLHADPDRLTQVLRNLLRNAVTHTQPGDRITVSAHPRDGGLEIAVSDTGPGIPADQLEHVFERFARLDPGRSRDRGGSGLGLAIARAIVQAHGGHIRAESEPGHGTTMRLWLPGYRGRRPAPRVQLAAPGAS